MRRHGLSLRRATGDGGTFVGLFCSSNDNIGVWLSFRDGGIDHTNEARGTLKVRFNKNIPMEIAALTFADQAMISQVGYGEILGMVP